MNTMKPIAILAGTRTPFAKGYGRLSRTAAMDLGSAVTKAVMEKAGLGPIDIDEVVMGNVAGPADSANVARVVALKAQIPNDRIAHTVNRNCGSGLESIISGWHAIESGRARVVVAGGTESMSRIPLLVRNDTAGLLMQLGRAKSPWQKLRLLGRLRPKHLKPVAGVMLGLTDPVCGLNMGQTAEVLANEFSISRADQDAFALESHQKASSAQSRCFLSGEISAFQVDAMAMEKDDCIRHEQTLKQLQKLRPIFDDAGTVTPGNSCPLTDGAAAVVLAGIDDPLSQQRVPLGYVTDYQISGCDPERMGLGPVYAINDLLKRTGQSLDDFDLIELNEAFAAQTLACLSAMDCSQFARDHLGRSSALGAIDRDKLNVHGGAIAIGHPVGSTGTRLVMTLLRALRERGLNRGLATLCVGGGQGMAMVVETEVSKT